MENEIPTEPNRYWLHRVDHGVDSVLGVFSSYAAAKAAWEDLPVTIGYRAYEIVDSFGYVLFTDG